MILSQLHPHQIPQAHFSWPSPSVTKSTGGPIWKSCLHLCYRTPCIPRRQIHLDLFSPQEPSSWLKPPWKRGQRQPGCHTHPWKTGAALLGNEQSWLKWLVFVFNLKYFHWKNKWKHTKKSMNIGSHATNMAVQENVTILSFYQIKSDSKALSHWVGRNLFQGSFPHRGTQKSQGFMKSRMSKEPLWYLFMSGHCKYVHCPDIGFPWKPRKHIICARAQPPSVCHLAILQGLSLSGAPLWFWLLSSSPDPSPSSLMVLEALTTHTHTLFCLQNTYISSVGSIFHKNQEGKSKAFGKCPKASK